MATQKTYNAMTGAEFNETMAGKKMYKLLNRDLQHRGYTYVPNALNGLDKTGEVFDPNPDCTPGGLYFCAESDIFEHFGIIMGGMANSLIAPVEIPEDAQVSISYDKFKTNKLILGQPIGFIEFLSDDYIRGLDVESKSCILCCESLWAKTDSINSVQKIMLQILEDKRVDPAAYDNSAIRNASGNGHVEVLRLLLQDRRADPSAKKNEAISYASESGHAGIVQLLLQDSRVNPAAYDNYAISCASENGYAEAVRLLLQDGRADPSANDNYAISYASQKGRAEVVRLLLQDGRADPSAHENFAIRLASVNGHAGTVRLLLGDSRTIKTRSGLESAMSSAREKGYTEIVDLLTKAMNA